MVAPVTGNDIARGTLFVIIAALLFALAPAIARFSAGDLNVLVLVFWTNLWMFVLMCCWVVFRPPVGGLQTERIGLHFIRSVLTYFVLVAYFFAVVRIPFANAVILQSMGPLFVPILALIVFRKLSDRYVWLGVLISFIGVLLIVRPDKVGISVGDFSALLAALGGAASTLVIWSLATTEPPDRQMFYFTLFALVLSALPLPWVWQLPSIAQVIQIILIAVFTVFGQFSYVKAFSLAPADKINTWIYMSVVFAAIIGYTVWQEPIFVVTVIGAALVVGGAHLATRESVAHKQTSK